MRELKNSTLAPKSLERQEGRTLDEIRRDHRTRYEWACQFVQKGMRILDLACGIGYGSWMLSQSACSVQVCGVDCSKEAIRQAHKHFCANNIHYLQCHFKDLVQHTSQEPFDLVVCFETLEHVDKPQELLDVINHVSHSESQLIVSSPNSDVLPYDKDFFPFHTRHFSSKEFQELLLSSGWGKQNPGTQVWEEIHSQGLGARFNLIHCMRNTKLSNQSEIKPYTHWIQQACSSGELQKPFVHKECRRLINNNFYPEALCYLEHFDLQDPALQQFWMACCHQALENIEPAQELFLDIWLKNKSSLDVRVSTAWHLSQMAHIQNDTALEKHWLECCLHLEPQHRIAQNRLKALHKSPAA